MRHVIATVLAGGKSKRMGSDKGALIKAGETMLEQTRSYLNQCAVQATYVSGHAVLGDIPDFVQDAGPLAGILSTLKYCQSRPIIGVLFVPVDMPRLNHLVINRLIALGQQEQKVYCYQNHFLPLYVPCNNSMIEAAQTILEKHNGSIKSFIRETNGNQLALPVGNYFININTPEDWQQFVVEKSVK
jgi:molybdopterin-guanine dinucleotide biosynthesis protein A